MTPVNFRRIDDPRWAMTPGRMDYNANYFLINGNPLDLSHIPYLHRRSLGASLMPEAFAYGPWAKEAELIDAFYQLGLKAFNEDRTMIEAQQKNINRSGNARMLTTSFDGALSQFRRMMDDLIRTESQQSNGAAIASSAG